MSLYMPADFRTASPAYAVSYTPVHTQTPVGPFFPRGTVSVFPFDVEFVFGRRGSVASEESDVV